ncbi:MAG: antibiotic biosynthesis monooxygenase, partial [Flavobacteriales bacterium]|nr:antibiotic biosynthesis monooxygenase [Flavobacteriales bacterium]
PSVTAQQLVPVVVTVDYRALPGQREALQAALQPLLTEVRKEPHYQGITILGAAQADPDHMLLVERWADQSYYSGAHGTTPHLKAFKAKAMALLAGSPTVTVWSDMEEVGKP